MAQVWHSIAQERHGAAAQEWHGMAQVWHGRRVAGHNTSVAWHGRVWHSMAPVQHGMVVCCIVAWNAWIHPLNTHTHTAAKVTCATRAGAAGCALPGMVAKERTLPWIAMDCATARTATDKCEGGCTAKDNCA
eukprot:360398-Chlamydomonas_euryale.AAC.5